MTHNKVYIAGPMSGIPNFNRDAFFEAERIALKAGLDPVNPARLDVEAGVDHSKPATDSTVRSALERDLAAICKDCFAIILLDGWEHSAGALAEVALGLRLGLKFYVLSDGIWAGAVEIHADLVRGRAACGMDRMDFDASAKPEPNTDNTARTVTFGQMSFFVPKEHTCQPPVNVTGDLDLTLCQAPDNCQAPDCKCVETSEPIEQPAAVEFSAEERATRASRESVYGDPAINLGGIGAAWAGMLNQHFNKIVIDKPIPASLVSLMMVAIKLNRAARTPTHEDSHHDAHVYMKLSQELAARGL